MVRSVNMFVWIKRRRMEIVCEEGFVYYLGKRVVA